MVLMVCAPVTVKRSNVIAGERYSMRRTLPAQYGEEMMM
jgi:hypothetical protein